MKILIYSLAVFALMTVSVKNDTKSAQANLLFDISKAFAKTPIGGPGTIDTTTIPGLANYARYNYYSVNGESEEYTTENPEGHLGMVNEFMGSDGLGAVMSELGYTTCNDIPTSGSGRVIKNGFTADITFKTGTRTIPAHFGSDAGQAYKKRLIVKMNGTVAFNMEFKCDAGSTITTGYLLLDFSYITGSPTPFEIEFQKNSATNAVYLDFITDQYMKMIVRFQTADGSAFQIYQILTSPSGGGNAVAVSGSTSGKSVINYLRAQDNNGQAASATVHDVSGVTNSATSTKVSECLDMKANSATSGCVAIPDPGALAINGSSHTFSISSMSSFTISTLADQ